MPIKAHELSRIILLMIIRVHLWLFNEKKGVLAFEIPIILTTFAESFNPNQI